LTSGSLLGWLGADRAKLKVFHVSGVSCHGEFEAVNWTERPHNLMLKSFRPSLVWKT